MPKFVLKKLDSENSFTDPIKIVGSFDVGITGIFLGTVTLQKSLDAGDTWEDASSHQNNVTLHLSDHYDRSEEEIHLYRLGFKEEDYESGFAICTITTNNIVLGKSELILSEKAIMKDETIYITQNSGFLQDIAIVNEYNEPIDLTGYSASMFISKYFGGKTKYNVSIEVVDSENEEITPESGILRISIDADDTVQMPYGTMNYSIFITPPDSDQQLWSQGQAIVIPTI